MTSERTPEAHVAESRPAPDWAGDVGLGVRAWLGQDAPVQTGSRTPSTPRTAGPATIGPATTAPAPTGRAGRKRGGKRTRTWEEREAARVAREEAAAAELEADPESVARKILLDTLTGQARTRQELADKLAKRGVPTDLANRLLDRFTEVGLVDDAAFARQWVESRHRSKGLAPRALAQELRRKGVDDESARDALDQIDADDQRMAARALVDKKMRSMRGLDRTVATRRLAGMLARKGYAPALAFEVVREALGDALDEDDSFDTD